MVRSTWLTPEGVIQGMQAGDFYATNGPELTTLEYDAEARRLEISVKPESGASYTIEFIGTREGYDATSRPVEAPDIDPARVTGIYSEEVGQVLRSVEGSSAVYEFQGEELYVRAVVRCSLPAAAAAREGVLQTAWTQPVGWERHVKPAGEGAGRP